MSLSVVKLLGSGEYAVELPGGSVDGHFGLAVRDYTHSTAPNRRFPDLATQRLVKAAIAGTPSPYPVGQLTELARHCTLQEDNAAKVERQVRKSAAALLLAPRVGQRFDAIVTGASPKGTWVRILHPAVEGRVVRGEHGLDVGDRGPRGAGAHRRRAGLHRLRPRLMTASLRSDGRLAARDGDFVDSARFFAAGVRGPPCAETTDSTGWPRAHARHGGCRRVHCAVPFRPRKPRAGRRGDETFEPWRNGKP